MLRAGKIVFEIVAAFPAPGAGDLVKGERRKARTAASKTPGKRHYRPKSAARPRLCADDVMSRVRLKQYQDSYAAAMSKYGLERGIDGYDRGHQLPSADRLTTKADNATTFYYTNITPQTGTS